METENSCESNIEQDYIGHASNWNLKTEECLI